MGIGLGLLIYGYKITYAIGEKLCKITPSRGVAIELSSALVIITGSRLKIPLSTTHCQVGATIGVGLLENLKNVPGLIVMYSENRNGVANYLFCSCCDSWYFYKCWCLLATIKFGK